jgi:SAM-dependent methyltransferase
VVTKGPAQPRAERPNERATNPGFELAALEVAVNYRAGLVREFAPYVRGRVLEVGAGTGQIAEQLLEQTALRSLTAIEPMAAHAALFRARLPGLPLIEGTIDDLPAGEAVDTIVSVNVLEHIGDDARELRSYRRMLAARAGHLCLCVPARAELYATIDRTMGHHRRYQRRELRALLVSAGFEVVRLDYFNFAGYVGWWLSFRLLQRRHFDAPVLRLFDRRLFRLTHAVERWVGPPPIGQSLLAICKAT